MVKFDRLMVGEVVRVQQENGTKLAGVLDKSRVEEKDEVETSISSTRTLYDSKHITQAALSYTAGTAGGASSPDGAGS
jgi:hypothetical protein